MYFVSRVFFDKETGKQSNSIQSYDDRTAALKRFYSVIAADIDNDKMSYEQVLLTDDSGSCLMSQVFDNRSVPDV